MPKRPGIPNYNNEVFVEIVARLLPTGSEDWKQVAQLYQVRAKKNEGRDPDDLKRHWVEKLCFKYKKPTGKAGDPSSDRILRCQKIQRQIQERTQSMLYGAGSDESEDSDDEDEDLDGDVEVLDQAATAIASAAPRVDPSARRDPAATAIPSTVPLTPAGAADGADPVAPIGDDEAWDPNPIQTKRKAKTKNSGASQRFSIGKSISEMTAALAARPAPVARNGLSNEALLLFMQQSQQQFLAQQQQQNQQFMLFMEAMKESKKRRRDEEE